MTETPSNTAEAGHAADQPATEKVPAAKAKTAKKAADKKATAKTAQPKAAKRKSGKKTAVKASAKTKQGKQTKQAKQSKQTKSNPADKPAKQKSPKPKVAKVEKAKKPKLVRDSFTMPEQEYAQLSQVKKACLAAGFEIKKSELLRIGVSLLSALDAKNLKSAQAELTPLRAGRPKKTK